MIRLGIIGCGDVAFRAYIPGILQHNARATVVATFDPIRERAEQAAAAFPSAKAFTSLEAFLAQSNLDGVFNLTPATQHSAINAAVIEAELHLYSEKPITGTVQEGIDLANHARSASKILLCAPATMATDRFQWINALVDAGRLGTLTVGTGQMVNMGPANWRAYAGDPAVFYSRGVGPVVDTGVYVLHGLTGIFGPALRVQAMAGIGIPNRSVHIPRLAGESITVESDDINVIQLDFGENRFAQILSSFAVAGSQAPAMEIHGSNGSISINASSWYEASGSVDILLLDDSPLGASGWMRNVSNPAPIGPQGEHLIGAGARHFIDCIAETTEPVLTSEHAIHVLDIILSARVAARSGNAVPLSTKF